MEPLEKITDNKLNLLVEKIIGRNWCVSKLAKMYAQSDPYSRYQEWDLNLDEIKDGRLTDHMQKRFTLYYLSHGTLEMQLIIVLNVIKAEIETKKSFEKYRLHEFA